MNYFYGLAALSLVFAVISALPLLAGLVDGNTAGAVLWAVPVVGGIAGAVYGIVVGRKLR